tara:strand:+ start:9853 stop:9990 length:138 start_codon:yes stop_codon:yes gene_type:complete
MPSGKKVGMTVKDKNDKKIAQYGGGGKIKKPRKPMSYKKGGVIKK